MDFIWFFKVWKEIQFRMRAKGPRFGSQVLMVCEVVRADATPQVSSNRCAHVALTTPPACGEEVPEEVEKARAAWGCCCTLIHAGREESEVKVCGNRSCNFAKPSLRSYTRRLCLDSLTWMGPYRLRSSVFFQSICIHTHAQNNICMRIHLYTYTCVCMFVYIYV